MWPSEIKKDCRVVQTGYSAFEAKAILDAIHGQLSDGWWENSPRMEGYWKFFCVEWHPEGATILISNKVSYLPWHSSKPTVNRFYGKTDAEILCWFADKIAFICREEHRAHPTFEKKPGNMVRSQWLSRSDFPIDGDDAYRVEKGLREKAKESEREDPPSHSVS